MLRSGGAEYIPPEDKDKWLFAPRDHDGLAALISRFDKERYPQSVCHEYDINILITRFLDQIDPAGSERTENGNGGPAHEKILQYIRNHGAWAFAFMIAMASPILGPLAALSPLSACSRGGNSRRAADEKPLPPAHGLPCPSLRGKHHPGQSAPHFPTLGETPAAQARSSSSS